MEKQKVTYITISEGKVYASGMEQPNPHHYYGDAEELHQYEKAMEKFNQSFVEVSNPFDYKIAKLICRLQGISVGEGSEQEVTSKTYLWSDGLYPVEGMVMEVQHQVREDEGTEWSDVSKSIQKSLKGFQNRIICTISFDPVVGELKCACGEPMNEGEAKTFTCCDKCWDKHYKSLKEGEEKKAHISGEGMKDITFSEIDPRIKESFPEPKEESTPDMKPDFAKMSKEEFPSGFGLIFDLPLSTYSQFNEHYYI